MGFDVAALQAGRVMERRLACQAGGDSGGYSLLVTPLPRFHLISASLKPCQDCVSLQQQHRYMYGGSGDSRDSTHDRVRAAHMTTTPVYMYSLASSCERYGSIESILPSDDILNLA